MTTGGASGAPGTRRRGDNEAFDVLEQLARPTARVIPVTCTTGKRALVLMLSPRRCSSLAEMLTTAQEKEGTCDVGPL
jgi:hypothetical protein